MEHILYHVHSTGFEFMSNMSLIQLKSIRRKYQKDCTTLCQLFKNLVFYPLHLILHKNQRFITYIEKYIWAKIKKDMDKLISSSCFRKQVIDIWSKSFKSFSYVKIDRKYQKYATFI